MSDHTEMAAERPLVTFALFAYNQEKYIREAVGGAFSQTYEPLEIILSDDCSTDRTFEIMQEMAAGYDGPHRVVVRRSTENQGIINHVLSVAGDASGALMVVAAGDDISLPERSTELAAGWVSIRQAAIYSGCIDINDDGSVASGEIYPEPLKRIQSLFEGCRSPRRYDGLVRNIPGYSAAYSLEFIKLMPACQNGINNEDALTTYVSNLSGREIAFLKKPLLYRRRAVSSISSVSTYQSASDVMNNEYRIKKFSKSTVLFLEYFSTLGFLCDSLDFEVVKTRLFKQKKYYETASAFWDHGFLRRVYMLMAARTASEFMYIVPRLFGKRVFCFVKLAAQTVRRPTT